MRLFLLGFYGYDNIGDEALLAAIVKSLAKGDDFSFKVLSYNAKKTAQMHAVEAVSRGKNFGVVKHIVNSDAIVVGGGSILQDVTSSKSLFYYVSILLISKLFGKKIYLLGNGFGPITRRHNRWFLKRFIPHIDGVVARDQQSYESYRRYGCKRLYNGVDCVFSLELPESAAGADRYVAIALRPWRNIEAVMEALKSLIPELNASGYKVKLVPMKGPDDVEQMRALCEIGEATTLVDNDLNDIVAAIGGARLLIGMRLHALILAAVLKTPFVAISYDPKIESFTEQLLSCAPLTVDAVDDAALKARVFDALERHGEAVQQLDRALLHNRQIAREQIEVFKEWVNQNGRTS